MRGMTVEERRRTLLSIATLNRTKAEMQLILGERISQKEWTKARKHARFPGPGKALPPKPKFFRKKLKDDVVSVFIEWLHGANYLQSLSFGHKVISYCNGAFATIEAVKLTANKTQIIKEYAEMWIHNETVVNPEIEHMGEEEIGEAPDLFADDESRCRARCKKSRIQCTTESGHTGRHKFTRAGQLSPSSIERILSQLTAGKIRSLAGLDDTDVEKGSANFAKMKALVKNMIDIGRFGSGGCKEGERILEIIDTVEEFHKVGFPRHLGQGKMTRFVTVICFTHCI